MNTFPVIEDRGAATDRDQKPETHGKQLVLELATPLLNGLILPSVTRYSVLRLGLEAGS